MKRSSNERGIYVEGGGDSKELHARCREGFRKLLENCGLKGKVPRIVACGSRNDAFEDFNSAYSQSKSPLIFLLVDSEDPVQNIEKPWEHLKERDDWNCPKGARDEQALLMTTCMETWIVADRAALRVIYRTDCLQESALPALNSIETKDRHTIQDALEHATRACKNSYAKGKRSFAVLEKLNPEALMPLPSFARMVRILKSELP